MNTLSYIKGITVMMPLVGLFLGGCTGEGVSEQLEGYVKSVNARKADPIELIPNITKFPKISYGSNTRRSPFRPYLKPKTGQYRPDLKRSKEPLEDFALDSLRMVGQIDHGDMKWALISAPDGTVYRISVGGHLGKQFGQVISIQDDELQLLELIDISGSWEKRQASLILIESEKK